MLKGKKLRNYLVYAVGEIILVVIGILIALWINNWNKGKEVANSNKILQEKVLAQLKADIDLIDEFSRDLSLNKRNVNWIHNAISSENCIFTVIIY